MREYWVCMTPATFEITVDGVTYIGVPPLPDRRFDYTPPNVAKLPDGTFYRVLVWSKTLPRTATQYVKIFAPDDAEEVYDFYSRPVG